MIAENRCPRCHGLMGFFIKDVRGKTYYRCNNSITVHKGVVSENPQEGNRTYICGVVVYGGKSFEGRIAFITDGKPESILVGLS